MKLLPYIRAELPGNDLLFYIVPLDPAHPAIGGTGDTPVRLIGYYLWRQYKK